jgi:hypothetical protein
VNETLQPGGLSLVQASGELATYMSCRGGQAPISSSTGIVTASAILCMPILFISPLLPGVSAHGLRTEGIENWWDCTARFGSSAGTPMSAAGPLTLRNSP